MFFVGKNSKDTRFFRFRNYEVECPRDISGCFGLGENMMKCTEFVDFNS